MKSFIKNNSSFVCSHCNRQVPPAQKTSRNHCPYCLYSLHLDIQPGDRQNICKGLMRPKGYEIVGDGNIKLIHQCEQCRQIKRVKALLQDCAAADDLEVILAIR